MPGFHPDGRRSDPRHALQHAIGAAAKVDPVSDVEETVHVESAVAEVRQRGLTGARQAVVTPTRNHERAEIVIVEEFTLEAEHVGHERLYRLTPVAQAGMDVAADRHREVAAPPGEFPGPGDRQVEPRLEAVGMPAQRPTRYFAFARGHRPGANGQRITGADEAPVDRVQLDGGAQRQPIDDHMDVRGAHVIAPDRRQRHRPRPIVRNHAGNRESNIREAQHGVHQPDNMYSPRRHHVALLSTEYLGAARHSAAGILPAQP